MIEEITSQESLEELIARGDTVVANFAAPAWCRPCLALAPHYKKAAEKSDATFVHIDVDNNHWASTEYNVRGVPTLMLFKDGKYVKHIQGRTVVSLLSELE